MFSNDKPFKETKKYKRNQVSKKELFAPFQAIANSSSDRINLNLLQIYHAIWNAILNHVANKLLTVSSSYSSKLSQNLDFPPRYADVNQKTIQTNNCICPIASELAQIKCILQQEKHHDKPLPSCIKPIFLNFTLSVHFKPKLHYTVLISDQ